MNWIQWIFSQFLIFPPILFSLLERTHKFPPQKRSFPNQKKIVIEKKKKMQKSDGGSMPVTHSKGRSKQQVEKGGNVPFLWGGHFLISPLFCAFFLKKIRVKMAAAAASLKARVIIKVDLLCETISCITADAYSSFFFPFRPWPYLFPSAQTQGLSACIGLGGKIRKWDLVLGHYIWVPTSWMPK